MHNINMASGKCAVGFIFAKSYMNYDQVLDYCSFHKLEYHSDLQTKKVYLFTRDDAVKVSIFIESADIDAVFVNIITDPIL